MFGISWERISGLIRHLLTFGGGYLLAEGWFDQATIDSLVAAAMTIIGAVWSFKAPEKNRVA